MLVKIARHLLAAACLTAAASSVAWTPCAAVSAESTPGSGTTTATPSSPVDPPGSGNLSERLDKSGGVIAPRGDVDSGMVVQPPNPSAGKMPVIPPPGTPGGNKDVVPK